MLSDISSDSASFGTMKIATDGCEAPGSAVDNGACNTGSAAAVGACSSVTFNTGSFSFSERTGVAAALVFLLALRHPEFQWHREPYLFRKDRCHDVI